MELLIGLIAELLLIALAPLGAVIAGLFGALAELVSATFAALIGGAAAAQSTSPKRSAPKADQTKPKRRRIWRYVVLAPLALAAISIVIINQFFFSPALRWGVDLAASRAGYSVEIDTVDGSIWSGTLILTGLTIVGRGTDGTETAVTAGLIDVDLAVLSLLTSTARIDRLAASDVEVSVKKASSTDDDAVQNDSEKGRGGRRFEVEVLSVDNATMHIEHPTHGKHKMRIETAQVAPLRSRLAAFDLLFRSNLEGSINRAGLLVSTVPVPGRGRRTEWALEEIKLETLAAFTDAAPIRWFDGGRISASMQDVWRRDDITMDTNWNISLDNASVRVPEGAGLSEAVIVRALDEVVTSRRGDVELVFRLTLDKDGFRDSASGDLSAWWAAMVKGIAQAVATVEPVTPDEAEGRLNGMTRGMRDFLGIKRDDDSDD